MGVRLCRGVKCTFLASRNTINLPNWFMLYLVKWTEWKGDEQRGEMEKPHGILGRSSWCVTSQKDTQLHSRKLNWTRVEWHQKDGVQWFFRVQGVQGPVFSGGRTARRLAGSQLTWSEPTVSQGPMTGTGVTAGSVGRNRELGFF